MVVYSDLYEENILIDKSITLTSLALFDTTTNTIAQSLVILKMMIIPYKKAHHVLIQEQQIQMVVVMMTLQTTAEKPLTWEHLNTLQKIV